MRIKIKNVGLYFISLLLFHSSIIKYYYVENYNFISLLLCIVVFLYLLLNTKHIFIKKFNKLNFRLILFSVIAVLSSVFNSFYNFDGTILYLFKVLNLFFFFEYASHRGKVKEILKLYFLLLLFYNLITLNMINNIPYLVYHNNFNYPFYASKFTLSYYFIIMSSFFSYSFYEKINKNFFFKIINLLLIFMSFYASNLVGCNTGIIGNILLLMFMFFPLNKFKDVFSNKKVILSTIIISSFSMIFLYDFFVEIPIIEDLIVNVFNRGVSLSGRKVVYEKIFAYLFSPKGLTLGFSYDGVSRFFKDVMYISQNHYALNSQNALLEIWMYFGLCGVLIFLSIVNSIYDGNNKKIEYLHSIIIASFILILLGVVEITFSFPLFLLFSIINVEKKNEKDSEKTT